MARFIRVLLQVVSSNMAEMRIDIKYRAMMRTATNKHEEDARHFYISFSLHCFRSMARCFATVIGSESNAFFLRHVSCHAQAILN